MKYSILTNTIWMIENVLSAVNTKLQNLRVTLQLKDIKCDK